eukprot:EG_transcript_4038
MCTVRVVCATAVPQGIGCAWFSSEGPKCFVKLVVNNRDYITKVAAPSLAPTFDEVFTVEGGLESTVEVQLHLHGCGRMVGGTDIKLKDLLRRPERLLVMFDSNDRVVMDEKGHACQVHLASDEESVLEQTLPTKDHAEGASGTHAMIMTRGTRGDVQPFVALARGLANYLGWTVTICTEMNCKTFIKEHSDVHKGSIRFAPSGGNTPAYVNRELSKWAIRSKSELMQALMLSRSEMEFFDSAPALMHWAKTLRPNVLIFGFTMTHIAMMISELLQIPMVGFILQPTIIPSNDLLALQPLVDSGCVRFCYATQDAIAFRKNIADYSPAHGDLNRIRKSFGLPTLPKRTSYQLLQDHNMPMVIPINEYCFGKRPADWASNTVFTDFIFLRQRHPAVVPTGLPEVPTKPSIAALGTEFSAFIEEAKRVGAPIVLMAFSSMPVPRHDILDMAIKVIRECPQKPRAIAVVGQEIKVPLKPALAEQTSKLKEQNLLLEVAGCPFDVVFPHMACVIIHGGLGTTAEALRAGVPAIVTGVLLMDQRFWGKRVSELQLGPEPVFIDDFSAVCVKHVTRVLGEYAVGRAKEVARLAASKAEFSEDGVEENALMMAKMFREHPTPWQTPALSSQVCCIS